MKPTRLLAALAALALAGCACCSCASKQKPCPTDCKKACCVQQQASASGASSNYSYGGK